ncbi:MAG: GNAT family N-acetyltransferase [Nocardiaceae bacterium]|nr:GNAT family N-acetyltransferase [Nocardiaceae bacterium]
MSPLSTGLVVAVWIALAIATVVGGVAFWVWELGRRTKKSVKKNFDVLPAIETPRLILRKPVSAEAASLEATIDDVMRDSNGWTKETGKAHVDAVRGGGPTPGVYVMVLRSTSTVIGGAFVLPVSGRRSARSLGWWVGPNHRGSGYATEAVDALVEAIHVAGYLTVEIKTTESNLAVQRICGKIGAAEVDRRPHTLPNGTTVSAIVFDHQPLVADPHLRTLTEPN